MRFFKAIDPEINFSVICLIQLRAAWRPFLSQMMYRLVADQLFLDLLKVNFRIVVAAKGLHSDFRIIILIKEARHTFSQILDCIAE